LKVLVACEFSGVVRRAFREKGHDAWSCDLLPAEDNSEYHYQEDVTGVIAKGWDLMIAHPPCIYLCSSGLHWNKRRPEREKLTEEALDFVRVFFDSSIEKVCIENPIGRIGTAIRKADQVIQPYQYGHDASKRTALWLKNLPLLQPTAFVLPRMVKGKLRWSNQTDSGQNRLPPSDHRSMDRSRTYEGIAKAMAQQWG
jgi:hypothetical protein